MQAGTPFSFMRRVNSSITVSHFEGSGAFIAVEDEVPSPDVVRMLGPKARTAVLAGAEAMTFVLHLGHSIALPLPQTVDAFAADPEALAAKQRQILR